MSNQLVVAIKDEALLTAVTFNYDELKTKLAIYLEPYNTAVTEDGIASAKDDRAKLNKLEAALKNTLKDMEQRLFGDFKTKVKELCKMIADASDAKDEQIKYYENREKDEKRKEIKKIFDRHASDLSGIVPLESIWKKQWENKTVSLKTIEAEIIKTLSEINNALKVINELQIDKSIVIAVKDYYLRTLDLTAALAEKTRLEKVHSDLLERERQKEAERQERVARHNNESDETILPPVPSAVQEVERQIDFRIWVTESQLAKLKQFILDNGIRYGRVE